MKKRPQNLNVWIVDDSTVDTFITKNALNDIDAIGNISHYNNPEKALELLVSSEGNSIYPDIILLDVSMPNMDGFEFVDEIDAAEKFEDEIPFTIVMLTNSQLARDQEKYERDLNLVEFLKKPIDHQSFEVLLGKIYAG